MPIGPITPVSATTTTGTTQKTDAEKQLDLGKDAFMKMMIESLRNQDPQSASDSKEFVQQLSQMTMLEQVTNMANATATLATETRDANAVGMLGKTITFLDAGGVQQEGVVSSIDWTGGAAVLKVGEQAVDAKQILGVR